MTNKSFGLSYSNNSYVMLCNITKNTLEALVSRVFLNEKYIISYRNMITFTYIGHSTSEESRTFDVKSTIPNEWRTAKSENFIPMNICLKYSGGSAYGDTPFIASYNENTGIVTFPKCANYGSASGWKYYLEYDVYYVR